MISTSKLSRLENAQGKPQLRDIRDLIRYYGIEGTSQAEQLRRWVAAADRPVWWAEYGDEVVGGLAAHLAYEADATIERAYTLPYVPALLQTEDYARAIFRKMEPRSADYANASFGDTKRGSDDEVQELVDLRTERQKVLTSRRDGLDPLKLIAVTHESALRQSVGASKILRDQLDELLDRSTWPNVVLARPPVLSSPSIHHDMHVRLFRIPGREQSGAGRRPHRDARRIPQHRGAGEGGGRTGSGTTRSSSLAERG